MMKKEHLKILRGTDFLRCYTEHVKVATRHNKKLYKEIFVMNTTIKQFEIMDEAMLTGIEGGCSWHGLAQAAVFTGAGNGFRLGVKIRTWQGAAAGAAGGLVIGGVGYGATCWW